MNVKSILFSLPLLALVAAGGWFGAYRWAIHADAATELDVRPFIVEQQHISYPETGPAMVLENRIKMRRRDGSKALIGSFPTRPQAGILRKLEWADGRAATLVDAIRARMSGTRPGLVTTQTKYRILHPPSGCAYSGETSQALEDLSGQRVYRVERTDGSARRVTEWRLADFECEPIQMLMEQKSGDTWRRSFEARLLFFREAEPDPAVFDDWASYEELTPSETRKRIYLRSGIPPEQCKTCGATDQRADEAYREFHERQAPAASFK